eukprot:5080216-Prymnesium_polylepis.1
MVRRRPVRYVARAVRRWPVSGVMWSVRVRRPKRGRPPRPCTLKLRSESWSPRIRYLTVTRPDHQKAVQAVTRNYRRGPGPATTVDTPPDPTGRSDGGRQQARKMFRAGLNRSQTSRFVRSGQHEATHSKDGGPDGARRRTPGSLWMGRGSTNPRDSMSVEPRRIRLPSQGQTREGREAFRSSPQILGERRHFGERVAPGSRHVAS